LDLDGTLLNSHGEVTPRNRIAIDKARQLGVRIAIVTGRRFRDARPIALDLGLDVPIIAHNGALTKHARTLQTVAVRPLSMESARRALRVGREYGADPLISDDHEGLGVLVYDHLSGDNAALLQYITWARRVHGEEGGAVREVDSLEEYLDHEPIHVAYSGGCVAMNHLQATLRRELGSSVKIFCTTYPRKDFALLDIVNSQASKGIGVAAVAAEFGMGREEVMAIGDNFNDFEMLQFAGTGVVMANAERELQEIPNFHTTASNDDDGVAISIEKFILRRGLRP